MITLLKQEWMKAVKQNRFYIWALIAFILPIVVLVWMVPAEHQVEGYSILGGAGIVVAFAGSVIAALAFTQEFSYGTIRPLLSRQYSRLEIFISKIVMIVVQYVLILVSAVLGTLAGCGIFQMMHGHNGTSMDWKLFIFAQFMDVIMTLFFFAIVLLVSNLVKSSAAAVSVGIILSIATSVVTAIMNTIVGLWEPFKWNPFTVESMLAQYFNGREIGNLQLKVAFGVDVWVIWLVYVAYLLVIYALTFVIFQRRSV